MIHNAVDTKYTLKSYHRQKHLLKKAGYGTLIWRQSQGRLQLPSCNTWRTVDQQEVKKAQGKLGPEIKAIEEEIASLKVVKKYVQVIGGIQPQQE